MRATDFFERARQLPLVDVQTMTEGGGLLVIAPHPDDETLGCGGIIAEACEHGLTAAVVVVSDGVGSHPASLKFPSARLRELRESETRKAVRELGLPEGQLSFLRLPDRYVPRTGPLADRAREAITAAARTCNAGAILATWRHDPHCDHSAVAALVEGLDSQVVRATRYAYPIWIDAIAPDLDVGPPPVGFRLDITRHRAKKARAIACHKSQTSNLITDDPGGFRLTPEMIASLTGEYEVFLSVGAR